MFNVGGGEILVILLLALIVLGPDKLPEAAQKAGKYMAEFRRMSSGFQQELKDAMKTVQPTSPEAKTPRISASPTVPPMFSAPTNPTPTAPASTVRPASDNGSATVNVEGPPGSFS